MLTTEQKPIDNTQKIKSKESKHITREKSLKRNIKRGRKKQKSYKTTRKQFTK